AMAVRGVDADVDRLVVVGEGPDPAADRDHVVADGGDRVDPAADPAQRLTLVHRHARLPERAGHQGPVQQVAGTHPQPPPGHDVEGEPGGVLVELPDLRVDAVGVELGPGQLAQRGDDADVGCVGDVAATERVGQ